MSTPINSPYSQFNYFAFYREHLTKQAMAGEPEAGGSTGASQTDTAPSEETTESDTKNQPRTDFIDFVQAFRNWAVLAEVLSGTDQDSMEFKTEVDGGEGDDEIDAEGVNVSTYGGDGNDTINARGYRVTVNGGEGDDTIAASSAWSGHGPVFSSMISGDGGNDDITTSGLAGLVNGGEGNDTITGKDGMMSVFGGSGDDTITAERGAHQIFGGAGNDTIVSRGNLLWGTAYGGAGDDIVSISGRAVKAYGGTGNDKMTFDKAESMIGYQMTPDGMVPSVEHRSVASGGLGDDEMVFNESVADIEYFAGDGDDTITGADERSVLKLGPGLSFEDTSFAVNGNDLTVSFGGEDGGSVTFKDYQTQGVPRIEFDDGRVLDASSTIAYAGGDPDAYVANDTVNNPATDDVA